YLKQVNELKDQFLANTSHELKTPLNGIIGLAESLLDEDTWADRSERDHNIELIVNSGRRLSNLVNDLLDFSKIRNNALELNPVSIDLHALVDVVVRIYRYMVKDKPLEVRNLIGKEMPAVLADEDRLQQILHNLIGNAVKFTEKGTIDVTARILDAGWVEIAVTDTGIGIPEDKQKSIFEAFVQGDGSTTRSHTGTGLGLAIARNLIELQQGSLKMESTPGLGSTFSFTLPISREAPVPLQVSMPVARPISFNQEVDEGKETSISRQMQNEDVFRILIVDDEPVNQQVLKNHLAREKYEMHFASSGAQALECLHQGIHFDLILLDIMMPQMSGYEVCQKIREEYLPAELPVILVTAKNRVEDLVTGLEQGANDYLAKPFTKGELLARIRTHLNLNHIHAVTNRFVPSHFLRALGYQTIVDVKLGDNVLREVTVLFSDIRDYTTLAESMSPSDTFHFVQAFSARMGPIIARHGGFVHQYLGDGIMAIFLEGPEKAIQAAIEMQLSLAEYNEQRQKVGRSALRLGIGLHTGPLIMGVIGDQMRSDAATISDTVNSASRMEGLTKDYRARILISAPTVTALPNREAFAMRFLGEVKVKGKQKKLGVFECMDADPPDLLRAKQANLNQFNRAMELYAEGDMNSVRKLLEELLAANPSDLTIRHIMDSLPVEMV
ncbi:MAG: response regulator, partial [Saprospiraceae bacterium]|nr:response regulator [Saprospiraceae bacterium]